MINIEVQQAKNGENTIKINEYYIHSKYNPTEEAERIANTKFKQHHLTVIFGYGLGYIVDSVLNHVKGENILIIDPLIEKGELNLQERHKIKNVSYWSENFYNTLAYTLQQNAQGLDLKINVIITSNYDKIFSEYLAKILKQISDFQSSRKIHQSTTFFFSEKWQENMIRNLKHVHKDLSLTVLQNKFKLPVVICSGGPSLTKQLPLLKKIQQNVIIIAAGSTINSLIKAGVEADFAVTIDGGEPNYTHFKDLRLENTRIIYSIFNHPGIRQSFSKRGYVFTAMQQEAIRAYLQKNLNVFPPMILGGGTVAHFTYSVAHLLNAGPITFIGQDLAYTNNETHAAHNKYAKSVEDLSELNRELTTTIGYYDEEVTTSKVFLSMKQTFEEIMRFHEPEVPVFNSTEGGVKIEGMAQIPFKQFVETYVNQEVKKDLSVLDNLENERNTEVDLKGVFEAEIKNLKKLKRVLEDALYTLKSNNSNEYFEGRVLKRLDKLEKKIEELSKEVLIYFLIEPITIEINAMFLEQPNETALEAYSRASKQSEVLYKRLIKAIDFTKNCVEDELEQM